MNADERETTISVSDADNVVRVWTAQRKVITRLRKNAKATETGNGYVDGTEWASFTIPSDQWNPASGIKRTVNMTPEAKAAAAARLAQSRAQVVVE